MQHTHHAARARARFVRDCASSTHAGELKKRRVFRGEDGGLSCRSYKLPHSDRNRAVWPDYFILSFSFSLSLSLSFLLLSHVSLLALDREMQIGQLRVQRVHRRHCAWFRSLFGFLNLLTETRITLKELYAKK